MNQHPAIASRSLIAATVILAAVFTAVTANAEFVRVTAANSVDNFVYDVTSFAPPGTIALLNSPTDAASHGSFSSVVQVTNSVAGTVDVLASDSVQGQIWRYTPVLTAPTGTPSVPSIVWPIASSSGTGPAHPDGLSLDSWNNLYIVTSKKPSVWVLPADPTAATGYAVNPDLIDANSFFALGDVTLQDSAVATTTTAAWAPNDLLVLVGSKNNANSAELIAYRANSIAQVLAGNGPRSGPDAVLIGSSQFPADEFPTGFDFWPADALVDHPTILVATTAGRVLRYDFSVDPATGAITPTLVQVFASGLGSGLQKIKVGLQLEVPYAFVTQTAPKSAGQILQLGAPTAAGATNVIGIATQGVNGADALAVARAAAEPVSDCVNPTVPAGSPQPKTCDIGGKGVAPHSIYTGVQSVSGDAIESTCVVATDPRWDPTTGQYGATTLDADSLCPGFGHEIIPASLVGGSGITGKGFALVHTSAPGVDGVAGITVYTQENVDNILPAPQGLSNPSCPEAVSAWAPLASAGEGDVVMVDPATGQPVSADEMVELTGFCDSSAIISRGMSLYGVGLILNPSVTGTGPMAMAQYAQQKYEALVATLNTAPNIPASAKQTIDNGTPNGTPDLANVETFMQAQDYGCAAQETLGVDGVLASAQNDTGTTLGNIALWGDASNPNPWGELRGRLANLYLTLNTRILGVRANSAWPPASTDPQPQCPAPAVTLTAPAAVASGSAVTISWRAQHALSCQFTAGDAGWRSQTGISGTYTTSPTSTTGYTLSCTGPAGTSGSTATVEVVPPPSIGSFAASPTSVTAGQGTISLSWSISDSTADGTPYPLSCSISGGASVTGITTSGTKAVPTPTTPGTTTYTFSCTNSVGGTTRANASVVAYAAPSITSFTATPSTLDGDRDDAVTLGWSAANAVSCAISGGGLDVTGLAATGTQTIDDIGSTTTYVLTCVNAANGATSASATVTVLNDDD